MLVLVAGLPTESSTAAQVHGDAASWTLANQLAARTGDALAHISWQLGGAKGSPPKPLTRPGVNDKTVRHGRTTRSRTEIVAYLRRFAPKRGDDEPTTSPPASV